MKAIVVKKFSGVPDGQIHAQEFQPNDMVEGRLADVAINQGWAVPEGGELPPDPTALRAQADAEIKRINEELEKLREDATLEKAEISKSVEAAKEEANAEIKRINDEVLAARQKADNANPDMSSESSSKAKAKAGKD